MLIKLYPQHLLIQKASLNTVEQTIIPKELEALPDHRFTVKDMEESYKVRAKREDLYRLLHDLTNHHDVELM